MMNDKNNETFYDQLWRSDNWGAKEINLDESVRFHAISALIEEFVLSNFKKGTLRIVDIGCGRGWLIHRLKDYGDILGIDITKASVERAKELYPDCQFFHGDVSLLLGKFGYFSFDLVVATEVIEHVPNENKKDFVYSLYNLLAKQGYAILTTPRGELWNDWEKLGKEKQPVEEWIEEGELRILLNDVGFTVLSQQRIFLPGFSFNTFTRFLNKRIVRRVMNRFFRKSLAEKIKSTFGFYQIVLVQKL